MGKWWTTNEMKTWDKGCVKYTQKGIRIHQETTMNMQKNQWTTHHDILKTTKNRKTNNKAKGRANKIQNKRTAKQRTGSLCCTYVWGWGLNEGPLMLFPALTSPKDVRRSKSKRKGEQNGPPIMQATSTAKMAIARRCQVEKKYSHVVMSCVFSFFLSLFFLKSFPAPSTLISTALPEQTVH